MASTMTKMLRDGRRRWGWSETQAAGHFRVTVRTYRSFEAGETTPNYETYERICRLFGWPESFVRPR